MDETNDIPMSDVPEGEPDVTVSGSAFARAKGTVADTLQAAADVVNRQAEPLMQRGQQAAHFLDRSARYIRDLDGERLKSDLADQVRRKPTRALLVAGLAGLALGALLRRG